MAPYTQNVKKYAIFCPMQIKLKHVASSTTRKTDIGMQPSLIELDHRQPATTLKNGISTTEGFLNSGMKPKRTKIWDIE